MIRKYWLTTLFFLTSLANAQNQPQLGLYKFAPDSCDYSVVFPKEPQLTELEADTIGSWQQANYLNDTLGFFLRSECIGISTNLEVIKITAQQYVSDNGLRNASYEYGSNELGHFAKLTGYKTLANIQATFRVWMIGNGNSYISLYAGGPSTTFPQIGLLDFFDSLELIDKDEKKETNDIDSEQLTMAQCFIVSNTQNENTPQRIDAMTTMKATTCVEKDSLIYYAYNYVVEDGAPVNKSVVSNIRESAVKTWCTDPALQPLFKRIGGIQYRYNFEDGSFIGASEFSIDDCEK